MKRIQCHCYGGPEEVSLEEANHPDPERGQIHVRVRAAAANGMNWKIRKGEMNFMKLIIRRLDSHNSEEYSAFNMDMHDFR